MIELIDKRKPNEKRFLKDNGNIEIQLFRNNIHYLKDGKYEEISNELKENKDSLENTENDYKVIFNKKTGSIRYNKENNYIEFIPKDYKKIECILEKNTKEVSKVLYKNIVDNIDLEYVLSFEGVKENIIINEYTKLDKIQFDIKSNLTIKNENKVLEARKGKELLFDFSIPYMKDSNGNESDEVTYSVRKKEEDQLLTISFSNEWLKSKDRKYPIIIDPTYENNTNVADTYIYLGDTGDTRYNRNYLNVGVEKINNQDVINRGLIRFRLPDDLGPSDEIVRAELTLVGYYIADDRVPTDSEMILNNEKLLSIHQLTSDWTLENANWNNMNNAFDTNVENVAYLCRSFLEYDILDPDPYHLIPNIQTNINDCLITNLVRKWLNGTPNYGIMVKQAQETYINSITPKLFSCNYSDGRLAPFLRIEYRSQNGLEPYLDYMKQSFTNGSSYINTFNGNLVSSFDISHTIGIFPILLSIIYNTNDVIQNINSIYGKGWRLCYDHTIEDISSNDEYLLKYIDGDGTTHIFCGEQQQDQSIIYYDIDGLDLIIKKNNSECELTDKKGNCIVFTLSDSIYYLSSLRDVSNRTINITRDTNHHITKIEDYNNNEINILYGNNSITINSPSEVSTLNYENSVLKTITTIDGTTHFTYDSSNKIIKIVDVNGASYEYEYLTGDIKKIRKVTQFGLNNSEGQSCTFDYNLFNTKITDNKGIITNNIYGYYGNLISSNNMSDGLDIKKAYSITQTYGNDNENKNKLLTSSVPTQFSKNYYAITNCDNVSSNSVFSNNMDLRDYNDSTFDGISLVEFFSDSINQYALTGFSLPGNITYTISLYIKTSLESKIKFYINSSDIIFEKNITSTDEYEKITFTFDKNSNSDLMMRVEHQNACSTYLGDIRIEDTDCMCDNNLITNPDFSNGLVNWNISGEVIDNIDTNENDNNDFDPTSYIEVVNIDTFNNKALEVNMESQNMTNVITTIPVKGNANDLYYLGFWYKNNGIETGVDPTGYYDPDGSIVGNTITILSEPIEGEIEQCIPATPLNACKNTWQYCSILFEPTSDYKSIKILLHQGRDVGTLYLTNFSLYKKLRTNKYHYDENGNVVELDNAKETNTFNYDENNELISATTPRGKHFKLEYDNCVTDRVLRAISSSGISNKIVYDNNGNPIRTKISKDYTEEINTGFYRIRLKGTNEYLKIENNSLTLKHDYCSNTIFQITKTNDLYNINDIVMPNKYITENSSMVVISSTGNKDFKIEKNANASFHLYIENNNIKKYLKWIENHFEFVSDYSDISNNYLYEFYFEDSKKQFIENEAKYTQDGRFITEIKDSLLNTIKYNINNTNGLITKTIDAIGQETNYTYNNKNQLTSVSKGNKQVNYTYNSQNLLSNVIQENNNYKLYYDNFLNISNIKINNRDLVTNTYEPNNGNLISVEYGNNDIISYQYDDYNRIKKITKEDNIYEYCYNKNGQIYKTKSNSSNKTYYYDDAKRLKEYKYNVFNDIFSIENIYDNDDNIINKKIMLGTNSQSIANSYDKEDYILESDLDSTNIKYSYDELKRIVRKKINNCYDILYDYVSIGNRTSSLIKSITNDTNKYTYNYDNVYNVTDIYLNSNKEHHYEYNIYNELIVDKDYSNNIKTEFLYDNNGNIITKTKKNLLTENIINTDTFEYTDNTWKDLLTKYNNDVITYDTIGNPLTIGNNTLTWINGRQLSSFSNNNLSVSYCYDENGLRTKKTVNGTDTYFYWDGSDILFEKTNNNIINYYYDVNGVIGLKYNNNNYYFIKNVQGDIISIYNSNNQLVAKYEYDSFGNILSIKDSNDSIIIDNTHVAIVNPYRYRGYYYDRETGLYYIKNRYYNPLWGRFINSDTYLGINHDFQSQNIFLYSSNNYISKIDKNGNWFEWISDVFDYLGELLSPGNVGNALAFVGVLSGLDGPAPVGDFIGICAFVPMLFIGLNSNAKETEKIMEKKKEEEVKKEKKKDVTVYFPENPYDFKPKGLVIDEHSGTSNGKIINWQMPVVKITIFEWDEDFDNGSHYHALKPEWNGKHDKKHYYAGDEVPSPWAEIYFGD